MGIARSSLQVGGYHQLGLDNPPFTGTSTGYEFRLKGTISEDSWIFFSSNTPRTGFRSYESRNEHKSANQRATLKLLVVQPVVHFFKERERERERAMGSLKKRTSCTIFACAHLDPKVKARAHWYFINSHPNCHMVKLPVL